MSTVTACLRDIEAVRRVATGAEEAYVARSRLSRLILRTTNLAGRATDPTSEVAREIGETCQQLDAYRRSATHASEPLDERWEVMWGEILSQLDTLQRLIETYKKRR